MTRVLFAFDFDVTITEADTDDQIFQFEPSTKVKVKELAGQMQFTDLVNFALRDLHETHRRTSKEILDHLVGVEVDPVVTDLLKYIATGGKEDDDESSGAKVTHVETTLAIISDSNTKYIDTLLTHHKVRQLFGDNIITNRGEILETDQIVVHKRHDPETKGHHGCPNGCAINLCKGHEILEFIKENGPFDYVVYSGDGKNDWCPSTKLSSTDYVCPRVGYRLEKIINNDKTEGKLLKAQVLPWTTESDLFANFKKVLNDIKSKN